MASKKHLRPSEFVERTGLSAKALRIYADKGILVPHSNDPRNGYRRYALEQVKIGRFIALLRGAGMGLSSISEVLKAYSATSAKALEVLDAYSRKLDKEHSGRRVLIRHIATVLQHEESKMFTVQTRSVPAQRGMSIITRLYGDQTDAFVTDAKTAFRKQLNGEEPTGPFTVIFHGRVDEENNGPIEAFLPCPDSIAPSEHVGIRTEPAHDQAFTRISKEQWEFPAILAAYDAVACSPEVVARLGSTLSCREVYLAEPDDLRNDEDICDVAFPLA